MNMVHRVIVADPYTRLAVRYKELAGSAGSVSPLETADAATLCGGKSWDSSLFLTRKDGTVQEQTLHDRNQAAIEAIVNDVMGSRLKGMAERGKEGDGYSMMPGECSRCNCPCTCFYPGKIPPV